MWFVKRRRWGDVEGVLGELLSKYATGAVPIPDTGGLDADLVELALLVQRGMTGEPGELVTALAASAPRNPRAAQIVRPPPYASTPCWILGTRLFPRFRVKAHAGRRCWASDTLPAMSPPGVDYRRDPAQGGTWKLPGCLYRCEAPSASGCSSAAPAPPCAATR